MTRVSTRRRVSCNQSRSVNPRSKARQEVLHDHKALECSPLCCRLAPPLCGVNVLQMAVENCSVRCGTTAKNSPRAFQLYCDLSFSLVLIPFELGVRGNGGYVHICRFCSDRPAGAALWYRLVACGTGPLECTLQCSFIAKCQRKCTR